MFWTIYFLPYNLVCKYPLPFCTFSFHFIDYFHLLIPCVKENEPINYILYYLSITQVEL